MFKVSIVRNAVLKTISYIVGLPRRLAWYIPHLRWWNREADCYYSLSFWGPNQTWLAVFIKEDLDENGHVDWATILWCTSDLSPSSIHQWWKRKRAPKVSIPETYIGKRLAFYGDTLTEVDDDC
jgi:hypothetical protein